MLGKRMEEKEPEPGKRPENSDRNYKKKRVEEIGSTLAQIRARHKANRSSCPRKEEDLQPKDATAKIIPENEKSEFYILLEEDLAKAVKLEKERPKIKEEMEKLKVDREQLKMVEKKIEETRAKQAAPLPDISPEVQKRISSMEMTIHSLRESLGEKDRVLSSKTDSLKMLNQQLLQKGSEFAEKAETMRKEVASLKQEYMLHEDNLRAEIGQYRVRLEETQLSNVLVNEPQKKCIHYSTNSGGPDGVVVRVCDCHAKGPRFDSLRGQSWLKARLVSKPVGV
ncbi:hypothetical protein AAG570_005439 [Ranatra chinensis]|uniref:Uncharacterized protein n=1 Tax=Ranatra chinensis TaxID=642074 RepID=A0ABD0XXE7_9HEMI